MIRNRGLRKSLALVETTHRGAQLDGGIANPQIRNRGRARFALNVTLRLWATASICFATGCATAAETTTSPICMAADLEFVMLIEAHGEAQDVAAEILAQAFFTVLEARKACNQGQVEAAMRLYESIPLRPIASDND